MSDLFDSDVGGGSVKNDTPHALARIPLRWMVRECFRCHTGIMFDAVMLQQIGLTIHFNNQGEPVLGELPDRIPVSSPENDDKAQDKSVGQFLEAAVHVTYAVVSYPFRRVWSILRSPFTTRPVRHARRVIPARHSSAASSNILRDDLPDDYEAEEERKDALSPLYDQLSSHWYWVFMEYMPMKIKKQRAILEESESADGYTWMCVLPSSFIMVSFQITLCGLHLTKIIYSVNKGRGRKIYKTEMDEGMNVHRSVKTRLEAGKIFSDGCYVPQVRPHVPSLAKILRRNGEEACRLDYREWNVDRPKHWQWVD